MNDPIFINGPEGSELKLNKDFKEMINKIIEQNRMIIEQNTKILNVLVFAPIVVSKGIRNEH